MESAVGSIANKVRSLPCFIPDTSTQQHLILACQFVCCLKIAQRNREPGEHGRGEKYEGRHGFIDHAGHYTGASHRITGGKAVSFFRRVAVSDTCSGFDPTLRYGTG
jgi:hypothetical protein